MTADFLTAAADAVRSRDSQALQQAIADSGAGKRITQRLFKEDLPMLLDPPDLLWLLQEITEPEDFARRRDIMLDALFADLCRNGYKPGIGFSVLADNAAGKVINVTSSAWDMITRNLSPRALKHYQCFVEVRNE